MFNRVELKNLSKDQLKGRWGNAILAVFLFCIINIGVSAIARFVPFIALASFLISMPMQIGIIIFFLDFVKSNQSPDVGTIFKGFNIYGKSLGICLWVALWTFLWSLLLVIPGIIKALAYSQSFYIIADNPNVKVTDAIKVSMKMTNGYKGQIFVMGLSFIGWGLLCILTLGIGFLWLIPYINTTMANMYLKLKELSLNSGACVAQDFGE